MDDLRVAQVPDERRQIALTSADVQHALELQRVDPLEELVGARQSYECVGLGELGLQALDALVRLVAPVSAAAVAPVEPRLAALVC